MFLTISVVQPADGLDNVHGVHVELWRDGDGGGALEGPPPPPADVLDLHLCSYGLDLHQVPAQLDDVGCIGRHLLVGPVCRVVALRSPQNLGRDGAREERADFPLSHLLCRRHLLTR